MVNINEFLDRYGFDKETAMKCIHKIRFDQYNELYQNFGLGEETEKFLKKEILNEMDYILVENPVPFLNKFPSFLRDEGMPEWFVHLIQIKSQDGKLVWEKLSTVLVKLFAINMSKAQIDKDKMLAFFPGYKLKTLFEGPDLDSLVYEMNAYLKDVIEYANQTNELDVFLQEYVEVLGVYCLERFALQAWE